MCGRSISTLMIACLVVMTIPILATAQPVIEVEPVEIDFGNVEQGLTASINLAVSNVGDERLVVDSMIADIDVFWVDYEVPDEPEFHHFEWRITFGSHSILVREILWDEELVIVGTEVGVFTPRGDCAGGGIVEDPEAQIGIPAWVEDNDEDIPGFRNGDEFEFRLWDPCTDSEVTAEFELIYGANRFQEDALSVVELSAEGGSHLTIGGSLYFDPDVSATLDVFFHPIEARLYEATLTIYSNDPDNEEATVDLIGIGGEGAPPEIREPVEEAEYFLITHEGVELEIRLVAEDPDGDDSNLFWAIEETGDLPGEQGESWGISDSEEGVALFTWDIGDNLAREEPYSPVFRVSDIDCAFDEITLNIYVLSELQEILDRVLIEDCDRTTLVALDTLFSDIDSLEFIDFEIIESPQELRLEIDYETSCLSAHPVPDYCVEEPGIEVTLRGWGWCDEIECFIEMNFNVVVLPLNDPPGDFRLESPEDRSWVDPYNQQAINFQWSAAEQNQYELDDVWYNVIFKNWDSPSDSLTSPLLEGTEYEISNFTLIEELNVENPQRIMWFVIALDDSAFVRAANSPFFLCFSWENVQLEDNITIPDHFMLLPAHPNPFNSRTTVGFGLPAPGGVTLSMIDTQGRVMRSFGHNGWYPAGYHRIGLDLDGIPTGSYLIRLEYSGKILMERLILVR